MTTWQAMHRLEQLGYTFELNAEGKILAKLLGSMKPEEATSLLAIVRMDRESAADYVKQRSAGAFVCAVEREYNLCEALAIGKAFKAGKGQLVGRVSLRQGRIFITWAGCDLAPWVEKVKEEAQVEMQQIDNSEYWELSAEEYEKMCMRYAVLAEVLRSEQQA